MFEHRHQPLLSHRRFMRQLAQSAGMSVGLAVMSLLIGIVGYHVVAGFNWVDSFLNASMILSGMGEVHDLTTTAGKIFAGSYALFSGVVFLATWTIVLAPLAHRVLHHFLWAAESKRGAKAGDSAD